MTNIKKTFKVKVLDELWVDSTAANNTMSLTYEGPAEFDAAVLVSTGEFVQIVDSEDKVNYYTDAQSHEIVTVQANSNLAAAYLMITVPDKSNYTLVDEVLEDDTVFGKIENPILHEYYYPTYNSENEEWLLTPRVRDPETPGIAKANQALLLLVAMEVDPTLDYEPLETEVLAYKQDLEDYIALEETKKAWKYTEYTDIPSPPASLVEILTNKGLVLQ